MVDIFGTLGPSCDDEEVLKAMFKEGMTGIRINLSHVMLADCEESIRRIQRAAKAIGITPKILIDMQGPELRIGDLKEPLELKEGVILHIRQEKASGITSETDPDNVICIDPRILRKLSPDQEVLLDDGRILAVVTKAKENAAEAKVLLGGTLKGRKSVAIKGLNIDDMPALTECDLENLKYAKKLGITGVMQPFVRSADDLKEVRKAAGENLRIYAKIENLTGVRNLKSFLPYTDEIIIARGDLGNAMPLWELPGAQKSIAKICREHNKPFMVVTQMLFSMEHSKVPTRAEVSDIYNAVADGASSVMVTGETAVGEYPVEVIRYLSKTAGAAADACSVYK
ncbi:pyruvate kinase [Butyrivibrio sp. FCS014]|uniref:pyruvate kinase n=1 Tax=Butyrivibrio sp. FCS014 TaxID=1408304 RepID=UPI0004B950DA|nr:pyruvate kinase [Butyrivibrio sp. FCS014]